MAARSLLTLLVPVVACAVIGLATPAVADPVPVAFAASAPLTPPSVEIVESQLAYGLEDNLEPDGMAYDFYAGDRPLVFLRTRAEHHSAVVLEWRHDREVVRTVRLQVGAGERGVWAAHPMRHGDHGPWTVAVRSLDGRVLETLTFYVYGPMNDDGGC